MDKTALITGIAGQDGAYLAKLLLDAGYDVVGGIRRTSTPDPLYRWRLRELGIEQDIEFVYMDVTDFFSVQEVFTTFPIREVYNLAAQSFVGVSWKNPTITTQVNAIGCLNLLEACLNKVTINSPKFYQASTSEMFGNSEHTPQNEETPLNPVSPYGISKTYAHHMVKNYRDSYNMFACSGILFNHESPLRGEEFISQKAVKHAIDVKLGIRDKMEFGNPDAVRDWGHAEDYVEAMWKMLQQEKADDYVIGTGSVHTVKELVDTVCELVGVDPEKDVVYNTPNNVRPNELNVLKADTTKAKEKLNWEPTISFEEMLAEMVEKEKYRRDI